MQKIITFLALIGYSFIFSSNIKAQQFSTNVSVGSIMGFSQFIPTEGYTPYFTSYVAANLGYDISVNYYFSAKTALNAGVNYYVRSSGVRIKSFTGGGRTNTSFIGNAEWMYCLNFHRRLEQSKNEKFELWIQSGIGLEYKKHRFTQLGGFDGLLLLDYYDKENWYPRLNGGITAKWKIGKNSFGVKLIGGIGFVYHSYYFYEGVAEGLLYYGVSRYKGDYIGLLATYEYVFSLKRDKDKKSKKKRKRKKKK